MACLLGWVLYFTTSVWAVSFYRHTTCNKGWLVRLTLGVYANPLPLLPVAFVLGIALCLVPHNLYEWTHAEEVAKDALLQHKAGYLNQTFL